MEIPIRPLTPITRVIIVAVDHSEYAEYALKWTAENYIRPATDLVVLVNVRPHIAAPGPYGSVYDFQEFVMTAEEHQRTESHRLLQDLARYLRHQKVCCKAIALRGDAREELVKKVEELSPDAFIIGSRGLGAVKRTFLGSVSDYCVHNVLTCPVIVVKHPKALKIKTTILSPLQRLHTFPSLQPPFTEPYTPDLLLRVLLSIFFPPRLACTNCFKLSFDIVKCNLWSYISNSDLQEGFDGLCLCIAVVKEKEEEHIIMKVI
ncbi:hypothetical protein BC829DRAFT_49069 [Chytridium lagenaria]|nr:hypothetical protein BC829DRAFT_49069 [Chytridium lagenaria]